MIPLSVPNLIGRELEYVQKAIETQWVSTSGSYVNEFENSVKKYLNVEYAVATQSGTASLHLALRLCGVTNDTEVIVPTLTFIATVNPVKYLGAEPIFMDCDDELNIDVRKLKKFLDNECILTKDGVKNKKTLKIIKAIVVVHVFGNMANMEKIMDISKKYNLKVIEDGAESLGTYYLEGKYKGCFAGTIGDFGVLSFNGNKIITTGGGGMLLGHSRELMDKARYLSTQAKDDMIYYTHNEIGYNYRMTNVQAAIGVAQMEKLEEFIEIKLRNYEIYINKIEKIDGLRLLEFNENCRNNKWFYSLILENYKMTRDKLIKNLKDNGIETRPIWGLIHNQKPYLSNEKYNIEKANYYINRVINIPCSTNLTEEDIYYIVNKL